MELVNATQPGQIYYGLHMAEGVVEYPELEGKPRFLVLENTIKQMNPTFAAKPVYVHHIPKPDLANMEKDAVGYVSESFFNKSDGKHWVKFIIVSDRGHEAIRAGWKLSNAFNIKGTSGKGQWHAVDYQKEVIQAEFTHLAIVPDPRYEESIILTPEQFKAYNSEKESELLALANSKETRPMLKFWKKTQVENTSELESATVTLSNGKEMSIKELINSAEEASKKEEPKKEEEKKNEEEPKKEEPKKEEEKKNEEPKKEEKKEAPMANGDHMVECGGKKMTVNELVKAHEELKSSKEEKKPEEEKKNSKGAGHFEKLQNASGKSTEDQVIDTPDHQVSRGKQRYGSSK